MSVFEKQQAVCDPPLGGLGGENGEPGPCFPPSGKVEEMKAISSFPIDYLLICLIVPLVWQKAENGYSYGQKECSGPTPPDVAPVRMHFNVFQN